MSPLSIAVRRSLRGGPAAPAILAVLALGGPLAAATVATLGPFPAELPLITLTGDHGGDGTAGSVFGDYYECGYAGKGVSLLGDFNGDGRGDFAITYDFATVVYFGRDSPFPADNDLRDLADGDGSEGVALLSPKVVADASGVGDVNGDGLNDIVVGKASGVPAFVVFGTPSGLGAEFMLEDLLAANGGDGSVGFALDDDPSRGSANGSVAAAGDVNGDGLPDILIGASRADPGGRVDAGVAYVIFGRSEGFPAEIELSSLYAANGGDGSAGFVIAGIDAEDRTGYSVEGAGDVNGDGLDDVVLGAPGLRYGARNGEAYVVFGRSTFPAEIPLSDLLPDQGGDGSAGFVVYGEDQERLGTAVDGAGDVNGDGLDDVVIGAPYFDTGVPGQYGVFGAAYVLLGRPDGFPATIEASDLFAANGGDGSAGFVVIGPDDGYSAYGLGQAVAGAGDVNGDGMADLLIGAHGYAYFSRYSGAYLIFGKRGGFSAEVETNDFYVANGGNGSAGVVLDGYRGNTGGSLGGGGDVNSDGIGDFIIGQPGMEICRQDGKAYLVYGRVADSDADGVPENEDNCTQVANVDQRDTNGDGFGNLCDADLNDDCIVNGHDFARMRALLGTRNRHADLDGNGRVGPGDVSILVQSLGEQPGPSGRPNACEPDAAASTVGGRRDSG